MYRWLVIIVSIFFIACNAHARPKLALVLSGGGAKGAAHVGVLKVLEQHNIVVDYITGTSIGAYIGGLYALGYNAAQIEQIMLYTDWEQGFSDRIARENLSVRDKHHRDQHNFPVDIGFNDFAVQLPSGVLKGQTMASLINSSAGFPPVFGSFDNLAIPYRAVAADIATREAVVLDSGDLVKAMQASMSVPGVLNPIMFEGRKLVDGGIANNMPVDVAKELGADIVIAVDIGAELANNQQLNSSVAILGQLSTFLTISTTNAQKLLLSDNDILIRPMVGHLGTSDFSNMHESLELGISAANQNIDKLLKYSVSNEHYQRYQQQKRQFNNSWQRQPILCAVKFEQYGHNPLPDELLLATSGLTIAKEVTNEQVTAAINMLYSLNRFQKVEAYFIDSCQLGFRTYEKEWGPNYIDIGLSAESSFDNPATLELDLAYTLTELNQNGAEWRNILRVGQDRHLISSFYQPLNSFRNWFSLSSATLNRKRQNILQSDEGFTGLEVDKYLAQIDTSIGVKFSQNSQLSLGFSWQNGVYEQPETLLQQRWDFNSLGGWLLFDYDNLNSLNFPTEGRKWHIKLTGKKENLSRPYATALRQNIWQLDVDWKRAVSINNHALVAKVSYSRSYSDTTTQLTSDYADLGGFLRLSGFTRNAYAAPNKVYAAVIYQYDLGKDTLGLKQMPLYLGVSAESGMLWQLNKPWRTDDLIYASSLYLGSDTALGPVALAFGAADTGDRAFYLYLGKQF
ncbi:patatin-like phospholipase family protein [Paraferrimonas sp. SM1919]|uniref:patatin-like phospholipase family protein n=1 Tax=Paraferrimonas sp. SM1919 TaxID=2662263 RepID=UPI0013D8C5F0|nr:patatin-like phospholipase family protein [Paraferrimonas sp. SM1919]